MAANIPSQQSGGQATTLHPHVTCNWQLPALRRQLPVQQGRIDASVLSKDTVVRHTLQTTKPASELKAMPSPDSAIG